MATLIASTFAGYKDDGEWWWLTHFPAWREQHPDLELFAAVQRRSTGDDVALEACKKVSALGGIVAHLAIEVLDAEGHSEKMVTNQARLDGICHGRNLAHEYANVRSHLTEILFIDTDVEPPADGLDRLLEVPRLLVGGHVPTYCLDGPKVPMALHHFYGCGYHKPNFAKMSVEYGEPARGTCTKGCLEADVREHWNTAGALLVRRPVFRRLRWRWDLESGQTDDPCFQADAVATGAGQTWVRHDSVWNHHPPSIMPFDQRGHDLALR